LQRDRASPGSAQYDGGTKLHVALNMVRVAATELQQLLSQNTNVWMFGEATALKCSFVPRRTMQILATPPAYVGIF